MKITRRGLFGLLIGAATIRTMPSTSYATGGGLISLKGITPMAVHESIVQTRAFAVALAKEIRMGCGSRR